MLSAVKQCEKKKKNKTRKTTRTLSIGSVHSVPSLSVCAAIVIVYGVVWEGLCNSASCLTL